MKKILLSLFGVLALTAWTHAQNKVIEDFDLIDINQLSNVYPNDSNYIVNNPAPDGVDSSTRVLRFRRCKTGDVWAGFWSTLKSEYDMTTMKYISVHIMKPRITVTKFKVQGGPGGTYELPSIDPQTKINQWETLNFSFPDADGAYPTLAMLLDFNDPVDLTDDIIIYVDDITLRSQPVGGDSIVIEDFQTIPLNQLSNGPLPNDSLTIVKNPAPNAADSSIRCLRFRRSAAGDIWAGFWSKLPTPIDMTTNKYILLKVWKPRISVVKFKIEGGTTTPATFELPSITAQDSVNAWQQLAFYFPDADGEYPIIGVEPDFSDPVGLVEDTVMYIDDIVSSPTATGLPTQVNTTEKSNLTIFPNPVKSTLILDGLGSVDRITLSNIVGQQVMITNNVKTERVTLNLSGLKNGIYLVTVYNKDGSTVIRKVIKEQ